MLKNEGYTGTRFPRLVCYKIRVTQLMTLFLRSECYKMEGLNKGYTVNPFPKVSMLSNKGYIVSDPFPKVSIL